jgi:hypothetical protein
LKFDFGFNVYRKPAEGDYPSTRPLNRKPVEETRFEDRSVTFGKDWCYVVRGVAVPIPPEPSTEEVDALAETTAAAVEKIDAAAADVPKRVAGALPETSSLGQGRAKPVQPPQPPALIESESTEEVCLTPIDTFPPDTPTRVDALEIPEGIMVSWSESDAPDLKGFLVYRSEKRNGPFELLTTEPIPLPSFTDRNLTPGETYFYAVSAVDSARPPNESARSSPVSAEAPQYLPPPSPGIMTHALTGE